MIHTHIRVFHSLSVDVIDDRIKFRYIERIKQLVNLAGEGTVDCNPFGLQTKSWRTRWQINR